MPATSAASDLASADADGVGYRPVAEGRPGPRHLTRTTSRPSGQPSVAHSPPPEPHSDVRACAQGIPVRLPQTAPQGSGGLTLAFRNPARPIAEFWSPGRDRLSQVVAGAAAWSRRPRSRRSRNSARAHRGREEPTPRPVAWGSTCPRHRAREGVGHGAADGSAISRERA